MNNIMTLAYSLANPPQAPTKLPNSEKQTEAIGHVPSGQTMPTAPNGKRKRSSPVVRNLGWEFDAFDKPVKKALAF
jgi:hypothetical protein